MQSHRKHGVCLENRRAFTGPAGLPFRSVFRRYITTVDAWDREEARYGVEMHILFL
jgi:hypothetical protein